MDGEARRLVVGRLRKAHGLKGDCAVFPLTDDPTSAFAIGRSVWVVDLGGELRAGPLEIERARPYHREWLMAFRGYLDRDAVAAFSGTFLAVTAEGLRPPEDGEVYVDELPGFAVLDLEGRALGLVTGSYELPGGLILEVQGPRREFLLPFRKEMVVAVDRAGRRLTVNLPAGLVDAGS
jgi:16S rRNA processing protein RimM